MNNTMRRLLLLLFLGPLVARADEIPDREPGMVVHVEREHRVTSGETCSRRVPIGWDHHGPRTTPWRDTA